MPKSKSSKSKPVSKRGKADASDPYVIDGEDVLLVVERTFKPAAKREWLARAGQLYPAMRGAKVADVLEVLMGTDAYLPLVEPYMESTGARVAEELKCGTVVISAAVRAAILMGAADYEPRAEAIIHAACSRQTGVVSFEG